jgi:hypothetical protein
MSLYTDSHYQAQAPLSPKVTCLEFRPCQRGTLRGFAKIKIVPWSLVVDGVALHAKGDRQWAQLPSRPQLDREGNTLRDETTGKVKYAPIMEIDDKRLSWALSDAIIEAVARKAVAQ